MVKYNSEINPFNKNTGVYMYLSCTIKNVCCDQTLTFNRVVMVYMYFYENDMALNRYCNNLYELFAEF